MSSFPGTATHQALLRAIVTTYQSDPRVRAVILFGSLSRGDWDVWSDIDLDVVLEDGIAVDPIAELRTLCIAFEPLGERAAVIVPSGSDAGDVVLESLMHLSVRYHILADTSPNIVADMHVLAGLLDHSAIAAAGIANRSQSDVSPDQLLDACVRYAAVANVYLKRGMVWLTVEILHRMRNLLLQLFAQSHGHQRSFHAFESEARPALQARLGATLPDSSLTSLRDALQRLIDVVETDLDSLSAGQASLTPAHRIVLASVRQDLAGLLLPA